MFRLYVLLLLIFQGSLLSAQEFGGHPPSVKWKQVNTEIARVIFAYGLDSQAMRIAQLLPELDRYTANSIGGSRKKINIVLQPATTISNAYVALGPFRSEFYLTPQQNSFSLGSLPWVDNLAIHEYRHVQQYNNFNRGLSKAFSVLFGEEGQALANALVVPDWFFEGDAVYNETKVSMQGRGRLPYFFNDYRALWNENKNYSWMKLRNGSLRDFVPDHYRLGYLLTAYGYEKYGSEFWKKISGDAASFKGLFYPWQRSIKQTTGLDYTQFRNQALDYFKPMTTAVKREIETSKHFAADQEHPYWIDDNRIIYLETSYKRRPRFVIDENGKKSHVRTRDISIDNYFSYRNNKIVYAAYQPDVRWGWRDYSDLKLLDVNSGNQVRLTKRARYFAPDISEDGNTVIAVNVDQKGNSALHLLNAANGNVERIIPNPEGVFYTYPKFYGAQKAVCAVRTRGGKMSVAIVDLQTGSNNYLLPADWNVIGFPWVEKDTIYFTAAIASSDQIFAWANNELLMLEPTGPETGHYQINTRNGKYVWTKFTAHGFRLMQSTKATAAWMQMGKELSAPSNFRINSVETDTSRLLMRVPQQPLPVTDYSQSFKLFNFHSRRPYISDPDYSFAFVSQNILNTLETEILFNYNRNEQYKQIGFSALYGQLFPLLRVGVNYTIDREARVTNSNRLLTWNELEPRIGFTVPLNLSGGKTFTRLSFGTDYVFNKTYFTGFFKDSLQNRSFSYISSSINFSNQVQQARQHIYPRLAQTLLLNYRRAMTKLDGNQFLASGSLYLPGFFSTHNIVLQAAFHRRDSLRQIRFSNSFPFSRGYATDNFFQMWKLGGNYHLPLLYPDWGFANLVYLLRVRSNMFYDFTRVKAYNQARVLSDFDFRSYGTEIFFDTRWWNQLSLSFGFRYSRLMDADIEGRGPNQWEFILPVNILSQ